MACCSEVRPAHLTPEKHRRIPLPPAIHVGAGANPAVKVAMSISMAMIIRRRHRRAKFHCLTGDPSGRRYHPKCDFS